MARRFIEGLPCAGKSLLVMHLEQQGFPVVHELGRVIPKADFPGDGKTIEEITQIDKWFINQERLRLEKEANIFDRSYFTHLAYAFAYSRLTKLSSFSRTVKQYASAELKTGTLVLVRVDPENSISRQEKKRKLNPEKALPKFWREQKFLDDLATAYEFVAQCTPNVLFIDGQNNTEKKAKKFLEYEESEKSGFNFEKYLFLGEQYDC